MTTNKRLSIKNLLKKYNADHASLTIELVLSHILRVSRDNLHINPEIILTPKQLNAVDALLQRHYQGEPLAYILGTCEFWSLTLEIDNSTLIPRPETELLVELSLRYLDADVSLKIAELGTGSGAIALALAHERRNWLIYATDISNNALQIAKNNAKKLDLSNIIFALSDWCNALPSKTELPSTQVNKFDAIISNPPYVALSDPNLQANVKQFEPSLALFAGDDGLDAIRIIIAQASTKLIKGGWLMLEHGFNQGNQVRKLMIKNKFSDIATHKDLAGHERVTIGRNMKNQDEPSKQIKQDLLEKKTIRKNLQLPNSIKNYCLEIYQSITSTNDYLKTRPIKYKELNICLAEQQTQGKGQFNRPWFSPFATNIYLSLALLSQRDCATLSPLSLAIGLATIKMLETLGIESKKLKCKWPNDIFWCDQKNQKSKQDPQKLAGILIEVNKVNQDTTHKTYKLVIGVGLNVNMLNTEQQLPQPQSLPQLQQLPQSQNIMQPWTSLYQILGTPQDRSQIAAKLINTIGNILDELEQSGKNKILDEWSRYDMLLNQTIILHNNYKIITGVVKGINELGHLKLAITNEKNQSDQISCYTAGEIQIQKT